MSFRFAVRWSPLFGAAAAALILSLSGCGGGEGTPPAASITATSAEGESTGESTSTTPTTLPETIDYAAQPSIYGSAETSPIPNPIVVLHTSEGDVKLELFMEQAPQTVGNFLDNYARQGFYEGTIFHHVDKEGFVLAGGYTADMTQKPTRGGIFNESSNRLEHVRGTIAMSREGNDPHSATSQFFINVVDNPGLNYQGELDTQRGYCVFGQVIEGMDVVDRIASRPVEAKEGFELLPVEPVTIESVEEVR